MSAEIIAVDRDVEQPGPSSLADVVARALRSVPTRPDDGAAVALAQRYAAAIDDAVAVAAALVEVDHQVDPADVDTRKRIAALAARVDVQAVLAELGPKLLTVLGELGMTPRARAAVAGKGGGGAGGRRSALDRIRTEHAARVDRTAAVDAAAS